MSPAALEKIDRVSKVATALGQTFTGIVAVVALVMIARMYSSSDARPDPWTGTAHTQYAKLVDERISHLDSQIASLVKVVDKHVAMDMHHGARVQFTQMTAELKSIRDSLARIEKRLDKVDGG